jgi:cytochrome c-type biogenesis protein
MQESVGIIAAFSAGILSFLSPCVLPLIPGYLSFITGYTTTELAENDRSTTAVLIPSALFVLGFSLVFVAFGASASVLGGYLFEYRDVLTYVAGAVVFVFGFFMLGIIKVPWLYGEARAEMSKARRFGRGAALVMGMAFAFGWTPCVGPILGSILAVASTIGSVWQGVFLLTAYSLGLGVPFILTALLFGRLTTTLKWLNRNSLTINRVAGVLLMIVGVLIFTGQLGVLAAWFVEVLPSFEV